VLVPFGTSDAKARAGTGVLWHCRRAAAGIAICIGFMHQWRAGSAVLCGAGELVTAAAPSAIGDAPA